MGSSARKIESTKRGLNEIEKNNNNERFNGNY